MRILAIRGENLASLGKLFEIDLTKPPLAGTGLFAITGDTGAGKSTILDALCLALYAKYPRVAIDRNEKVPDPRGEPISAKDAGAILRRGAAQGFAEVDFVGQDGVACRVRWEVGRARGKANGNLTKEQRWLSRLDDGVAIADGAKPVLQEVEARTGLTFEQFRRTVLLAQGEFDAFLLADDKDRAELLEKITGTEIYARVSARVNAGAKDRKSAVDKLEDRRAQIGLMEPAAREAAVADHVAKEREAAATRVEVERLNAMLAHAGKLLQARERAALAASAVDQANAAFQTAAADRTLLARLDAVEPLRRESHTVRDASARRVAAAVTARDAQNRVRNHEQTTQTLAATLASAVAVASRAEGDVARFEPAWAEAARLDTELAMAARECAEANAAALSTALGVQGEAAALAAIDARAQTLGQALSDVTATLHTLAHAPLAERAEEISERLASLQGLRAAMTAARTTQAEVVKDCERRLAIVTDIEVGADKIKRQRAELARQLSEHRIALTALDAEALADREFHLRDAQEVLRETLAIVRRHATAAANLGQASALEAASGADVRTAELQLEQARAQHAALESARREIASLADLAEATVSKPAVELRSRLVAGETCPVCGSDKHPFAESGHAESALVGHIQQRRTEIDAGLAAAQARMGETLGHLSAGRGRSQQAARDAAQARSNIEACAVEFVEVSPRLARAVISSGLSLAIPRALADGTAGVFERGLATVVSTRNDMAQPLAKARALRHDIDTLRETCDRLDSEIERASRRMSGERADLEAARGRAIAAALRVDDLTRRQADTVEALAPALVCAGIDMAELDRDPAAVAQQVHTLSARFATLQRQSAAFEAGLRTVQSELAGTRASLTALERTAAHARSDAERRKRELEGKTSARALLLNGEPTTVHRERHVSAHRFASVALTAARDAVTEAEQVLTSQRSSLAAATAAERDAGTALEMAQRSYAAALSAAGLTAGDVDPLLALPSERRVALREGVQRLQRSVNDAEAALAERRRDLAQLEAEPVDGDGDVEAIRRQITERTTVVDRLRHEAAALKARLDLDDTAGRQAADLSRDIETQRADLAIWLAVDTAIGSADGSKFRRFAQGVTLDQLVRLANEQLAALKPRYQLARGATSDLALHVIDHDMGEDVRAVRSLSGGERFLVSLALALALSGLEGRQSFVDTLFIDEGFGSLDAETLDLAIDALETLQSRGRKVGVITHVAAMIDRIAVQIRVQKRGNGRSVVQLMNSVPDLADLETLAP